MIRLVVAIVSMVVLSGCVTLTAPPSEENVVYSNTNIEVSSELKDSVSMGEVSGFPGTSIITLSGKISPNLDDEAFSRYLSESLSNAGLLGDGYTLNAELIDSNDWSDWGFSLGDLNRNIEIEYTLLSPSNEVVFSETIIGNGELTNYNPLHPFYLLQKKAAEKGYSDNIRQLVEKLASL
ncbi:MAG: hypothetical protein ACQEUM_11610 [Pseudomonadota bacterium]